ncbi:modification methylase [Muribacter muris]|uniref:site-specific DNA-methyltransferase (adenine-specific) n=1 Tax=Muribacter muris TaxID=67855 RepID=A0A4Y9JZ97_9PAST|nr:DNA adenine methylase [Muribacter muris]MBF0785263.1 DNA adenine methylase [Muribacter muris]MBF0828375.1 DNA adenine methylase [Muribacter muris]TFV10090.1 modification methylase [Muribacter muris]
MNYIGSKNKLSQFIISTIKDTVGNFDNKVFCELFAGTGIIGSSLKTQVKKIISNDIEYYSYILNRNYIGNNKIIDYFDLFDFIESNKSNLNTHFIFNQYSENGIAKRLYFSESNGRKIDQIRSNIKMLYLNKDISDDIYYFCLASLLESADKHANTASVYGAYLKSLKHTAKKDLVLQPAKFDESLCETEIYNQDSNQLIKSIEGDILYLDPPYNTRQYGANYHLLNTIAKYDYFEPIGKTGLRNYTRSRFCQKNEAYLAFKELIENANFKYIFISYNNEGILSLNEIREICSLYGRYDFVEQEYQRFKADNTRKYKDVKTVEYLHILEKN